MRRVRTPRVHRNTMSKRSGNERAAREEDVASVALNAAVGPLQLARDI